MKLFQVLSSKPSPDESLLSNVYFRCFFCFYYVFICVFFYLLCVAFLEGPCCVSPPWWVLWAVGGSFGPGRGRSGFWMAAYHCNPLPRVNKKWHLIPRQLEVAYSIFDLFCIMSCWIVSCSVHAKWDISLAIMEVCTVLSFGVSFF